MPYISKRVPAEVLTVYGGITVYYSYDHDEYESPLHNMYQLVDEPDLDVFDVRDLPNFGENPGKNPRDYHADVIKEALSHGYLDEYMYKVGVHPKQNWPDKWQNCNEQQMRFLIKSYAKYTTEHDYETLGAPLNIISYYTIPFKKVLEEAKFDEISGR